MGIHYDYKSTKSAKLMEKQAKREKKLAEKKAKRLAKEGPKKDENKTTALDPNKPISSRRLSRSLLQTFKKEPNTYYKNFSNALKQYGINSMDI